MDGAVAEEPLFGKRLKDYRTVAGLSRAALAGKADVSPSTVANLEKGRQRNARVSTIKRILDALTLTDDQKQAMLDLWWRSCADRPSILDQSSVHANAPLSAESASAAVLPGMHGAGPDAISAPAGGETRASGQAYPVRIRGFKTVKIAVALAIMTAVAAAGMLLYRLEAGHEQAPPALTDVGLSTQNNAAVENARWIFDGSKDDLWEIDQRLNLQRKGDHTSWTLNFRFTGSNDVGMIGLQTDGARFDGLPGELAIFSIEHANAGRNGSCKPVTDGGSSFYSCRLPLALQTGATYRLRVWREETEGQNQWWGAWVLSSTTGENAHIGDIRVPKKGAYVFGESQNYVLYFGPPVSCNNLPKSSVDLLPPAANSYGDSIGTYGYYARYYGWGKTRCPGGGALAYKQQDGAGVRLDLGGVENAGRAL